MLSPGILMRPPAFILAIALLSSALNAQTLDARHMRVQYEDERVRVIQVTLPPGESTSNIGLNERLEIAATDGTIRIISNGKELAPLDVRAGSVRHEPAAWISIVNVGAREFQTVITEFKAQFAKSIAPLSPTENLQSAPRSALEVPPAAPAPTPSPASQPSAAPQAASPPVQPQPAPATQQPAQAAQETPSVPEPTALNADGAKVLFVNGTELAYIERGRGPVVVLVHDTLGDYRSWASQLTALSRGYRVVAYSRRYHYPNHSNGKEHDYNYAINAKDLADFIRALNTGSVRLVGFGYGATIAGMVAADHPELVKALVLTEPAYEQLLDKTMAFRSQFAREEIYGIIRKPLTKDKPEKGLQVYVDWLGYQSWAAMSKEEQYRKKQNANALHAQTLDAAAPDFACSDAKKITAPTFVLSGQRRSPNSAEIAGVLSACIPNAERATVSNSGAAIYIDNPAEANRLLADFLSKH